MTEGLETYPGSRERPPSPDDVILPRGRRKLIYGQEAEVFTTGQLAAVLNRSAVTIRKWEHDGIIPKSQHDTAGADGDLRGRRRYYTRAQVLGIVAIAKEQDVFTPGPRINIQQTFFTQKVRALFRRLERKQMV